MKRAQGTSVFKPRFLSQMSQQILTFRNVFDIIIKRIDFVLRLIMKPAGASRWFSFLFKNHFVPHVPLFLVHKKSADNQCFRQVLKNLYHLHFFVVHKKVANNQ